MLQNNLFPKAMLLCAASLTLLFASCEKEKEQAFGPGQTSNAAEVVAKNGVLHFRDADAFFSVSKEHLT